MHRFAQIAKVAATPAMINALINRPALGNEDFTAEEIESAMVSQAPGAPNYSILSFTRGFHGRLFGSLSTTHSKPIHKLDIPGLHWSVEPFPQLKYPLNQFAAENRAEERCLQEFERTILTFHNPIVAAVVEPILLGLVEQTARVGKYLYTQLEQQLAQRYPNEIKNLWGKDRGTFLAWDSPRRDEIIRSTKANGVNIGGSSDATIRLRPMLIFKERHDMILYYSRTGASGYVGGQALRELARSHPDYTIAALIRDGDVAKRIAEVFPKVRAVVGDLDNSDLIAEEASKASVVLRIFQAIHRGLAKRASPSFWVQISGASALAAGELASPSFKPGSASSQVYDDVDDIASIRSLVRAHPSRVVDNYLLDVAKQNPSIKTALVLPPIIYGAGEGPVNQRSFQIPVLCKVALERGKAVKVGEGQSRWGNVHVRDVGKLVSALAEAGAKEKQDEALWGENGIYLAGIGELTWEEIAQKIANEAHAKGLIATAEVERLDKPESDAVLPAADVLFGSNARSTARRGVELLGWTPTEEDLEAEIPRALAEEVKRRA
ncbi:hypothetical protein QQZ08_002077 [Neonectria magnoliae]|uniref:NAD-dependent epimerase/dehydratase domain-containing protein n=1 Tax=Neonectria magnoliae TaxID=2732573 RepID=A0ABR1ICP7_9HYPO